jgi:hypothetical protein
VTLEAVGGPVIDELGRVVAIAGGSLKPGGRIDQRSAQASRWLSRTQDQSGAATPLDALPEPLPSSARPLSAWAADGFLTRPLSAMPEFIFGGTTRALSKDFSETGLRGSDYSVRDDPEFSVYSHWARRGKISRGMLSVEVYDAENRVRFRLPPQRITLRDVETRMSFVLTPRVLGPGYFRVDVLWDGNPAWRTYVRIVD